MELTFTGPPDIVVSPENMKRQERMDMKMRNCDDE